MAMTSSEYCTFEPMQRKKPTTTDNNDGSWRLSATASASNRSPSKASRISSSRSIRSSLRIDAEVAENKGKKYEREFKVVQSVLRKSNKCGSLRDLNSGHVGRCQQRTKLTRYRDVFG